jgi:hypothetical protein
MNPFTWYIMEQMPGSELRDFVEYWDLLEALVIRTYKTGSASQADEAEFQQLKQWLVDRYAKWQIELEKHWRVARINGEPAQEDPYRFLLSVDNAREFVGCWHCLQTLPAAREALNAFLIELLDKHRSG